MSAQLSTARRLLTRFGNKLLQTIESYKEERLEFLQPESGGGSANVNKEHLRKLEEAVGAVDSWISQVEATLDKFLSLRDSSSLPDSDPNETERYSVRAEDCIATAVEHVMLLRARIRAVKSAESMESRENMQQATTETHAQAAMPRMVELPTLPIPKFKGNIWDWENFWELFTANVHSQELSELLKFHYLLDALQGQAKESVRKFHVTKDNYTKAIEFLHTRYVSGEELIQKLIDRLEKFQLRSQSLKDQSSLMEQVQVIIEQLRKKGSKSIASG
uniref:Uncharacterized protein n=1 Tax=Haemonchus contortus TaxID=6289 RepID=A0A7I4Z4T3_HAECO|nr:Protein of unknown function DUF1759 domain containing protein [Haemonchus contortus]